MNMWREMIESGALGCLRRWGRWTTLGRSGLGALDKKSAQRPGGGAGRWSKSNDWTDALGNDGTPIRRMILISGFVVFTFFGGFGGWAALAPLESAAIATGQVKVSSHLKTINHLGGGIVRGILVREGELVAAGQVLLTLESTQARATLDRLSARQDELMATEARLRAEREGLPSIGFPDMLVRRRQDPDVMDIISGEAAIFKARRRNLDGQVDILRQRILQSTEEIAAYRSQLDGIRERKALLETLLGKLEPLGKNGHVSGTHVLEVQLRRAEVLEQRDELKAQIARVRKAIGETELQISDLENTFAGDVVDELRDVQVQLVDVKEQVHAANDVLIRTEMVAPLEGTVVNLRVHTVGSAIESGAAILDLVPRGDALVVEAQVDPRDIAVVEDGLPVRVHLTAFNLRYTEPLTGRVSYLAADRSIDPHSGAAYYVARVAIDPIPQGHPIHMYPGMPAEVMFVTGERTALEYLIDPIRKSFARAWREPDKDGIRQM